MSNFIEVITKTNQCCHCGLTSSLKLSVTPATPATPLDLLGHIFASSDRGNYGKEGHQVYHLTSPIVLIPDDYHLYYVISSGEENNVCGQVSHCDNYLKKQMNFTTKGISAKIIDIN